MIARRLLVRLHLWFGLTVGLVWALQGLTGAALVFHRELDRWGVTTAAGPMAPIDRLVAAAEVRAGRPIRILGVADGRGDLLVAYHEGADGRERRVRIEAATARVVDDRAAEGGWGWLYALHESLLLHGRGEALVGASGLLLASMAMTGLWIGWPGQRGWRGATRPGLWRGSRARLYGWHRLAGLLAGAALVAVPLSGAAIALRPSLWPVLERFTSFRPPFKPRPAPPPAQPIAPGEAWAAARRVFPDGRFVRLTMPGATSPAYVVRLLRPGELRAWSGTSSVVVDEGTGRVLSRYDATAAPLPNRLYDAAFPVHNGEATGLLGRVLVMLAGLSLPTLYVTGLLAWLRKLRSRATRPKFARGSSPLQT